MSWLTAAKLVSLRSKLWTNLESRKKDNTIVVEPDELHAIRFLLGDVFDFDFRYIEEFGGIAGLLYGMIVVVKWPST